MKKLTQPWKLRRSFGSQPVGNVDGPRWPEAGIATRVIPAQSSRWTFRGPSYGDLATCVLDSSHGSDVSTTLNSKVVDFAASLSSKPRLPSQGPAIVRTSPTVSPLGAILLSLLPTGNSEEPRTFGVSSFSAIFNI